MNCYCCSEKEFKNCCQPFINGTAKPLTAEELMRSRYSAYYLANAEYISRTTHPSTRKNHQIETIKEWAKSCQWEKLKIIASFAGGAKDKKGIVEFKAFYLDSNNQAQIHHERSNFSKELGKWFYVDGKLL